MSSPVTLPVLCACLPFQRADDHLQAVVRQPLLDCVAALNAATTAPGMSSAAALCRHNFLAYVELPQSLDMTGADWDGVLALVLEL